MRFLRLGSVNNAVVDWGVPRLMQATLQETIGATRATARVQLARSGEATRTARCAPGSRGIRSHKTRGVSILLEAANDPRTVLMRAEVLRGLIRANNCAKPRYLSR